MTGWINKVKFSAVPMH